MDEVPLHHHDFYEIYLFLSGNVIYNVESRNYRLHQGDMLLISPLELHQPVITPQPQPYKRIVLWISKSFVEQLSSAQTDLAKCFDVNASGHVNLLRLDPVKRQWVIGIMESIIDESYSGAYGGDVIAAALLAQLLAEVNRQSVKGAQRFEITDRSSAVVTDVLQYINENYARDISLDALAAHFFLSKYHLSREFRRLVGTSVYRYIIQKRLLISKQMILAGQSPTGVYGNCGFGDYTNFYRAFKAEYGISPKVYADSVRNNA